MNKLLIILTLISTNLMAQKVEFKEFDLDNGLHVIMHKDNSTPVVVTSVAYHVGSKNEDSDRTGFAHFFEHLLFEGTQNIKRGEFFKIVSSNGGNNNAYTTEDMTYYYEVFPSNNLELGLWLESERMLHPVINKIGVDTQNEVVKEEKRMRMDNAPYGSFMSEVKQGLFKKHPYRWNVIGSMKDLDAASLEEFIAFKNKFYVPNNATLVVAGDLDYNKAEASVKKYFAGISNSGKIIRNNYSEKLITTQINRTYNDPNIQVPAAVVAYRTPGINNKDVYVMDMISTILSSGKSSRLYKKMIDVEKISMNVGAMNNSMEDYGVYIIYSLPLGDNSLDKQYKSIEQEIEKLQNKNIPVKELEKLKNKHESRFVNNISSIENLAEELAKGYIFNKNTNNINEKTNVINSITVEDIKRVANKYLGKNQRLKLQYLPKK